MIYDCFTFFNEVDVLEMRLEELYPVVDRFVLIEMDTTFQGRKKGSVFSENEGRFGKYSDKITHYLEECPDEIEDPWKREYFQRNRIGFRLNEMSLQDSDVVLVSDVDEIPRRQSVSALNPQPVQALALTTFYYGINIYGGHYHTNRAARWDYARTMTTQQLRTLDPPPNLVYDAGWHFSYLGTPEHIAEKFKSFAHHELNRSDTTNTDVLVKRMQNHDDLWGDGHKYQALQIDSTWPEAVKRDRDYWRKYEW